MKIQVREDVVYSYNKDDEVLAILGADESSTMYRISGWFGKKLFELLEGKLSFDDLPSESQEIFSRLMGTLVQENILATDGLSYSTPLPPKEWESFGGQSFWGSLLKEESLLAHAHERFNFCLSGPPGTTTFVQGGCAHTTYILFDPDGCSNINPLNPQSYLGIMSHDLNGCTHT